MDTAGYVEKISALFNKIMLDQPDARLAPGAEGSDLTGPQFQGLAYLLRHDETSIGELAEGLSISHPAAVKMVDRLGRKGFVRRTESPRDRRVSFVLLTDLGRRTVEKAQSERLCLLAGATARMSRDELECLVRGLEALFSAVLETESAVDRACLRCGASHIGCCPVNRAHAVITGAGVTKT
jgi:DNA-binding MarR family transcriptional regulator